jgi:hypothetical protein
VNVELKTSVALGEMLTRRYAGLQNALHVAFEASERAGEARRNLAYARQELLIANDPKTLGANEATREATLSSMLTEELGFVSSAERAEREAKYSVEMWRLQVEEGRALLRLLEVQAGTVNTGDSR